MKVVIFCGGKGYRMGSSKEELPKPLFEIGEKPILWHLMKIYEYYGYKDFILCLGYRGEKIKEYFADSPWNINFVDTGINSTKAERLNQIKKFIKEDNFLVSYGDDLSNVNIKELINYHNKKKKIVTLTTIKPESPFGIIDLNESGEVEQFKEKPKLDYFINGGFYVFNKKIFDYLGEGQELEKGVFNCLIKEKQIVAFKHKGFWKSMNTFKDNLELNKLWETKKPWAVWE